MPLCFRNACGCVLLSIALLPSLVFAQTKRSKSDSDMNTIGQRDIGQGPNFYSLKKEKELGAALAREVERSSVLVQDAEVIAYVERIAHKVEQSSDKHICVTIHLLDSDMVDGFVLPAGHVYMNRGLLLKVENEGELAGLLARGIAHTALRSYTRLATKAELTQIGTVDATIFGFPGTIAQDGSTLKGSNLSIPLLQLKERRDFESAADYFGVQYLYKSGYEPQCFVDFVEHVWGSMKPVPKVFSTYPLLPERIKALQTELAEILPTRDAAITDTSAFREFEDRLQALPPAPRPKPPELRTKPAHQTP